MDLKKICCFSSVFQLCLHYFLCIKMIDGAPPPHTLYPNGYSEPCGPNSFGCFDGTCLPFDWICDGNEDCLDGEDEFCVNEPAETGKIKLQNIQPKKRSSNSLIQDKDRWSLEEDALSLIHEANLALEKGNTLVFNNKVSQEGKKIIKRNNIAETAIDDGFVTTVRKLPVAHTATKRDLQFFTSVLNTEVALKPSATVNFPSVPENPLRNIMPTSLQNTFSTYFNDVTSTTITISSSFDNTLEIPTDESSIDSIVNHLSTATLGDLNSSEIMSSISSMRRIVDNAATTNTIDDIERLAPFTIGSIPIDEINNTFILYDETYSGSFSTSSLPVPSISETVSENSFTSSHETLTESTASEISSTTTTMIPQDTTEPPFETSESPETVMPTADPQSIIKELLKITKDLLDIKKYFEEKHLQLAHSTMNCSKKTENLNTKIYNAPRIISKITCPYNFQFIKGICVYTQIYPPVSWHEAAAICAAQNGILLSITSKPFFEKLLKQLNFDRMRIYDFWIGATNTNEEAKWIWADGKEVTNFDIWGFNLIEKNIKLVLGYNQPHKCAFLDGKLYSYINEDNCYVQKGFICQSFPYTKNNYQP